MNCKLGQSTRTKRLKNTTVLGYQKFTCGDCGKQFNERTGTAFNYIMYPTSVVMYAALIKY